MIFLPSRDGADRVRALFESGVMAEPGVLITDGEGYGEVPANWQHMRVAPCGPLDKIRAAFAAYSNEPWYGILADDIRPEAGWDTILAGACQPNMVAYGDDGRNREKYAILPFLGGDLVRSVGGIVPDGFTFYGIDNFWFHLGKALGRAVYRPDAKLSYTPGPKNPAHAADKALWDDFRKTSQWRNLTA